MRIMVQHVILKKHIFLGHNACILIHYKLKFYPSMLKSQNVTCGSSVKINKNVGLQFFIITCKLMFIRTVSIVPRNQQNLYFNFAYSCKCETVQKFNVYVTLHT